MEVEGRQFNFTEGTDVYGSDGDKVGSIVAVQPNYIVVEKGFFFPTDYYIPTSAIANSDDDRLYLNVTKDAALNQGWDTEPTGDVEYATTGSYTADMGSTTVGTADIGYGSDVARADAGMRTDVYAADSGMAAETTRVEAGDTLRVPVREEELTATTRERQIGEVQITKDVISEEKTLEVPITEERVRVERRVVDRPADASDATAFQEGTIEVPIRGQEVDVQKQVRVSEEIEIGKEQVQRTEQVGGTVRREEVRISEDVIDAGGTTTGTTTTASSATTSGGRGQGVIDRATDAARDAVRGS